MTLKVETILIGAFIGAAVGVWAWIWFKAPWPCAETGNTPMSDHHLWREAERRAQIAEARVADLEGGKGSLWRELQQRLMFSEVRADIAEAFLNVAEARVERYREAIQNYLNGNYDHPRAHRPNGCRHGRPFYEECETCIDEHFFAALNDTKPEPDQ